MSAEDDQARIDAAASQWLMRRIEGPLSADEARMFRAWCEADPRHRQTFEALSRTWNDLGHASGQSRDPPVGRRRRHGRHAAAVSLALAASLLVGWLLVGPVLRPAPHRTAVAERAAPIRLEDGSLVTLAPGSAITPRFDDYARRVILTRGEAFFDVAHDATRSFYVEAGPLVVRAVGTQFNVRRNSDRVQVAVLDGIVEVSGRAKAAIMPARLVRHGEKLAVDNVAAGRQVAAAEVVPAVPGEIAAWRRGDLHYDNALLGDVVEDINRYYPPGVSVQSSDVGRLRVTGAFRTEDIPAFLDSLSLALPVTVTRAPDGRFTLGLSDSRG